MAASLTQLTGGSFQDCNGNPLSYGYLTLKLSQDGNVAGVGNICSGVTITIQLDVNGNVASLTSPTPVANQYVWANSNISPINTYYKVTGFTQQGERAFGLNNQQVAAGATFNVGTWVPNSVISWFPNPQSLALEVNGVAASSQTVQNLEAGSNITITDEGGGNINISASEGTGPLFETNSVANANQAVLNLEAGTGITLANPSGGNVTITNTGGASFSTAGIGGFFGPGVVENFWSLYTVLGAPLQNSANAVDAFQFELQATWTLRTCSWWWTNNLNGYASFAIYNSTGTTKLIDVAFNTSIGVNPAPTPVELTFSPVTLPPGVYYFAQAGAGAGLNAPAFNWLYSSTSGANMLAWLNLVTPLAVSCSNARSGTTMPATLGTMSAQTNQAILPCAVLWTP
jgi:hypothetical protein